jgi:predicted nucleic acid-binding protein
MAAEIVLDASVAAKCFITETGSDIARHLVGSGVVLIAPEFLFVELASVAAKRVRRGDISRELGAKMVEQAPGLLDQTYSSHPYALRAFDLAAGADFQLTTGFI